MLPPEVVTSAIQLGSSFLYKKRRTIPTFLICQAGVFVVWCCVSSFFRCKFEPITHKVPLHWYYRDQSIYSLCLIQETTGSIRTKGTAEMPFKCSATWKQARPASPPTRPVSPARPGGPNPLPEPTNQCGTERTLAVAHW